MNELLVLAGLNGWFSGEAGAGHRTSPKRSEGSFDVSALLQY